MESPSAKKPSIPFPLPEDIVLDEIVPKLPARCVIRFKSVSKTWQSRISQYSSLLATRHTAREQEPVTLIVGWNTTEKGNLDGIFSLGNGVQIDTSYLWRKTPTPNQSRVKLFGSCEGLVCLQLCYSNEKRDRDVVLWNPATREVNYLPAATASPFSSEYNADYFLGFDAQTGDHKVVRLEDVLTDDNYEDDDDFYLTKEARIFSRKSGNWRELKPFTSASNTFINEDSAVTIDGVIYWSKTKINVEFDTYTVLSFDPSTEELREFEGPPVEAGMDFFYLDLTNWKGSLCAIWNYRTMYQLWLKNDSNTGWTNISTMDHSHRGRGITKLDNFTLEWRAEDGPLKGLYCKGYCHHFHTLVSPN